MGDFVALYCSCRRSLFSCALAEAAALPLQYLKLKSHDALAGRCRYSYSLRDKLLPCQVLVEADALSLESLRCAFVEVARPLQYLKSYLPPHCLMVGVQLKYTPLLLGIVHRRCHYSPMVFCCCRQSLFRCVLTEAAALPLQYLKSHDALAGGCHYSST